MLMKTSQLNLVEQKLPSILADIPIRKARIKQQMVMPDLPDC